MDFRHLQRKMLAWGSVSTQPVTAGPVAAALGAVGKRCPKGGRVSVTGPSLSKES